MEISNILKEHHRNITLVVRSSRSEQLNNWVATHCTKSCTGRSSVASHPAHVFMENIPSSADSRRASCQLLAKEWTLYTGKVPLGGLSRNNVVLKVTDHPDMTKNIPSSADSRRASCQLLAKEWTLYMGKLPLGDLSRKCDFKVTDHPDMTSAVYFGRKASNQTKPCNKKLCYLE